jgi:uncharacterized protein (TIGR04551 family)
MLRRPFAVTALAGLVSWAGAATADPAPAGEKRPDAAPSAPPAAAEKKVDKAGKAREKAPAADKADNKKVDKVDGKEDAPPSTAEATTPPTSDGAAPTPDTAPREGTDGDSTSGSDSPATAVRPSAAPGAQQQSVTGLGPIGLWPQQGAAGTSPGTARTDAATAPSHSPDDSVLAEDWWSHSRPVFEIHGYFRTRAELFHNFSLGRRDTPDAATWPQPIDNSYTDSKNTGQGQKLCTIAESGGSKELDSPTAIPSQITDCRNKTQAGANLRFRLDPELHVSDNLRVVSQIDILDNVVMGSTPSGYAFRPAATGGYATTTRSQLGVMDDTIVAPQSGVNSLQSSIAVKRVWAEYTTPVGQLRFGRMPDHFGLGMVHNSGDGYDDDYQSTIDRLQFISAIKPLDLYIGGSWDFPNEGPISQPKLAGGQAYDLGQLDDVNQWSLLVMRKQSQELVKTSLAHDQVVVNGGAYVTLRKQLLANDAGGPATTNTPTAAPNVPDANAAGLTQGSARRNANIWLPDLWLQLRYKKFRFEAEGAAVLGSMDSTETAAGPTDYTAAARKIREYGFATEIEQKLVEDRLRLNFGVGWASGDASAYSKSSTNNLIAQPDQQPAVGNTISTFRFHPAYRVDLILNRNLLQRVQGTYYVRPAVEYDFMRKPTGQRLGGGAGIVWTRASEFVQTPGHARDLGIELDGRLYFQSKDGGLNDRPEKMGGFFAMLEYGVLFPLAGLDYLPGEKSSEKPLAGATTSAAQILRLYMGVLF